MKFIYETDMKRLRVFREQERLDVVIKDAKTQLEKIILLNDWTHHQICLAYQGPPIIPFPLNVFTQLDYLRTGKSKGYCGSYVAIFVQACLSVGIPARSICLRQRLQPLKNMHNVADAWDDDHKKWVCVDPSFNLHFMRKGIPLSVFELHNAVIENKTNSIVVTMSRFSNYLNSKFTEDILRYFQYFMIGVRNNFISNPTPLSNLLRDYVLWEDGKSEVKEFFWDE